MKQLKLPTLFYGALLFLSAFTSTLVASNKVVQYSSYVGLIQKLFDGFVPMSEVLENGDHGIGTTHALDGEAIIMDGFSYRVTFDGDVEKISDDETTPYITIADTSATKPLKLQLSAGTCVAELTETVKEVSEGKFQANYPYAVRIEGVFKKVKARSIPKLEKPYIELSEVAANQSVFEFEDEEFTIIGFWNPKYADAFNPPEWHIHGLNKDLTGGGHILDFETGKGVIVKLWKKTGFDIHLPDTEAFAEANFDQDFGAAVQQINRDK
ncbi:MAG: acetolactate decarboxylase [Opitutales bacterium]|nr:acetolactate decarboxylase [Opitutales bacterium]